MGTKFESESYNCFQSVPICSRHKKRGCPTKSCSVRCRMSYFSTSSLCNSIFCSSSTFVVAGADSTANAICTMMDILSRNPAIQDKLRAELVEAQERLGTDIPHDELVALPYMDAFCRETLRLCVFIVCGCALNPLKFLQGTHPFHLSPESMSGPFLPLLELTSGYD